MVWLLSLLGALMLAPEPACATGACSCVGAVTPADALQRADAVFSGRVVSVREVVLSDGEPLRRWTQRAVTLKVDRAWKGLESDLVTVVTGMGGGDCGYTFARGRRYLVYANGLGEERQGALSTGICDRTRPLAQAAEDLRVLGTPAQTWRAARP